MGSTSKHCLNSATTSEESHDHHHHPSEKFKEDNRGKSGVVVGRFYECNFCKRGFTNAQALGGHMNIHRKDKDRGNNNTNKVFKQRTPKSSLFFSSKSAGDDEECTNNSSSRYFEQYLISNSTTDHHHHHHHQQQQQYRSVVPINGEKIMNCFQFIDDNNVPTNSNPNLSTVGNDIDHHLHDYSHPSTDSTANLSIQIDHHHPYNIREDHSDEGRNSTNWEENELDLELRLG